MEIAFAILMHAEMLVEADGTVVAIDVELENDGRGIS